MSEQKVIVKQRGMGWLSLLGVVFVTLKLLGITAVAAWSWLLVTMPFWIIPVVWLTIAAVCSILLGAIKLFSK